MSFFEPPPPPPEPEPQPRPPQWMGPPGNAVGAVVPLGLVLARTDDVAVAVGGVVAYPNGLELSLAVRTRRVLEGPLHLPYHPHRRRDPLAPDVFRFGVQFADGRKATTLGEPFGRAFAEEAPDIVLISHGGGGGGRRWDQSFWLWPLPPAGTLSFVCEWPAFGIELTRHDIDADLVLEAAARAVVLWPEDDDGDDDAYTVQLLGSD
jgi:hypothetical protein